FITGGVTPLNKEGECVWPKVGDDADLVFVEASCSAEVVARRARRIAVLFKGNLVAGALKILKRKERIIDEFYFLANKYLIRNWLPNGSWCSNRDNDRKLPLID